MYRYLFLVLVLFYGCTGRDIVKNSGNEKQVITQNSDPKKEAMKHFINGSVLESKGSFTDAVSEYEKAYQYDKAAGIAYAIAKNYYALGKFSSALDYSKKSVAADTTQKEYLGLLGDIYNVTHQTDSAVICYNKMVELDSSDITALYRLAGVYEKSKPSESVIIYNHILNILGPEWTVLSRLAEINEKLGNLNSAAENIKGMLSLDPSNNSLRKYLAGIYIKSKQPDSALIVFNELIEINPDDNESRERKAQILLEKNEWILAAEEYKYLLSLPGVTLETKIRIGAAYFVKSLKDSTVIPTVKNIFEKIDKDTTDWQVKLFLGAIALVEKKDSAAERYFKKVIELAQYNSEGWVRLGSLYFDNQRYEEAIKLLNQAVEIYPQDFAINLILGLSYAQSGDQVKARGHLKTAVDQNRNDVTALSAYGYTLSQLKENEEAVKYLKRALALTPDDVNLLGTLGLIYDGLEMWKECDSTYERALEIDSSNALVNNNYAYSLSERNLKLERALKMANIAVKAEPYNSSYLDTIGWVFFKMGKYDEAGQYIKKALEVAGDKPVLLEHLGDVTFKKGEKSAALELWQKAYSLDSSNTKLKLKIEKGEI